MYQIPVSESISSILQDFGALQEKAKNILVPKDGWSGDSTEEAALDKNPKLQ